MKQTIEYYYDLKIDELFIEKDVYHFIIQKEDYYFFPYFQSEQDLNMIIDYSRKLKSINVNCHDLLLNIKKEHITKVDEVGYILLKVWNKDKQYNITDIIDFNKKVKIANNNEKYINWAYLWSKKIDYIEEQLQEIKVDNTIKLSVDYYIGLTENAIYYVNTIDNLYSMKEELSLSHKRIYYPNTKLNYLNPVSFIIDLEVRDVAEYLKAMFWAGDDALLDLKTYLKSVKLTPYSYNMLFARLLYPSYYFDLYEEIINKNGNREKIIKYVKDTVKYEQFLKKAYEEISSYAKLLNINWLIY